MEQLVKLVAEKTGISTEQATTAVNTVMDFIKDKLPAGLQGQMDALLSGSSFGDMAGGMKDKIGGMFNK